MCCECDTGIEPAMLWRLNAVHTYRTNWNCGVWPTHRLCYIGNISDHDDVGVVWWDQNTVRRKKICFHNKESNDHSTQITKEIMTKKNPPEKSLLWV